MHKAVCTWQYAHGNCTKKKGDQTSRQAQAGIGHSAPPHRGGLNVHFFIYICMAMGECALTALQYLPIAMQRMVPMRDCVYNDFDMKPSVWLEFGGTLAAIRMKLLCLDPVAAFLLGVSSAACTCQPSTVSVLACFRVPAWTYVRSWLLRLRTGYDFAMARLPAPAPVSHVSAHVRRGAVANARLSPPSYPIHCFTWLRVRTVCFAAKCSVRQWHHGCTSIFFFEQVLTA